MKKSGLTLSNTITLSLGSPSARSSRCSSSGIVLSSNKLMGGWLKVTRQWLLLMRERLNCLKDSLMSRSSHLVSALQLGDFGAGQADQLVVGVGMPFEAPSPRDRLREDPPGSISERWITRRARSQFRQLPNHG